MNTTRRLRIAAAAALLTTPVLASCGVSFGAPTDQPYTPAAGVNDHSGAVDVLNALIVSGTNGSGTVVAALVNNNQSTADKLTGVTGAGNDQSLDVKLAGGPIDIPAGGLYQLANKGEVTVTGDQVQAGAFVKITFAFQNAESITVEVPVVTNSADYKDVPLPSAS